MGKWNRWGRTLSVVVLAAAVVCGCGVKETLLSGRKSEREYGKAETMVIVTTERLRYEELYTDKIWDTVVDESGTTFEETLLSQIHDFLKELKTMSRMADEEKVTLSGKERELAKQAAAHYIKELKPEEFEVKIGDLAGDGSQLRPFIVWFGESVPEIETAIDWVEKADVFVIIGTSMNVYPAAGLLNYVPRNAEIYLIDPKPVDVHSSRPIHVIQKGASEGVAELREKLLTTNHA